MYDQTNLLDRQDLAKQIVQTILQDLDGMEEYAEWSSDRVLYIPLPHKTTCRVCIETRVGLLSDWAAGIKPNVRNIRITYRCREHHKDSVIRVRTVRLVGDIPSITKRVRSVIHQGFGILSAL